MGVAIVFSRGLAGLSSPLVTVEVHLAGGLPAVNIVGLPDTEVRESRDRVKAALQNAGFDFPMSRVTINLAPADLPKESARLDLPIAIGILAASGQVPADVLSKYEFAGELALTGALRPVRASFAMAIAAKADKRVFILPAESAAEAAFVPSAQIRSANTLLEVVAHLHRQSALPKAEPAPVVATGNEIPIDLSDVRGQTHAKRALEIAAAGQHSLFMIGPPGTGKSMLAQRLPTLLPPMAETEAIEAACVASLVGKFDAAKFGVRRFVSPHHSASVAALVGGGRMGAIVPGEISQAHHGVLFLDELAEFQRNALEALREPLETGEIHISRSGGRATFPARFQLIAAMNPCPCGYLGHVSSRCRCTSDQVARYRGKISGPLMDRLDLQIEVSAQPADAMMQPADGETSEAVRTRVLAAVARQHARQGKANSSLAPSEIDGHCALDEPTSKLLAAAITRLGLSGRAHHRILRVARTIADLAGAENISTAHVAEAIGYRKGLDKR